MNPSNGKLRKPRPKPQAQPSESHISSFHWLFRSNIPRRRTSYLPPDINKRNFFGMGEIITVHASVKFTSSLSSGQQPINLNNTQPAETVRSLAESKKLLDEAHKEINESRSCSPLRTKHTITRLPGFFPRKAEMFALERALEGEPSFTILCGASSVGKVRLSLTHPSISHHLHSKHACSDLTVARSSLA